MRESYPLSVLSKNNKPSNRLCVQCDSCGSVTIIAGDRLHAFRKGSGRFFCDPQCAGDYKKWHNKTDGYRKVMHRPPTDCKEHVKAYRRMLYRGWKCCLFCGNAFCSTSFQSKFCGHCRQPRLTLLQKMSRGTLQEFTCEECGGVFHRLTSGNLAYCSNNCSSRHSRRKQRAIRRARKQSTFMEKQALSWKDVFNKHNGICVQCGCKCTKPDNTSISRPTDATLDHILPLAKGGWHARANAQLLCFRCNSAKRDQVKTPEQLRLLIRKLNVLMAVADSLTD